MMPVEPTEERMFRWEEVVIGHPLLAEFLGGADFTNPEAWLLEVGNHTRQVVSQLDNTVGTDWAAQIIAPLHEVCIEKEAFSQKIPVDIKFEITRMLFLLGYDLGSTADVSLACDPVWAILKSTGVLNGEISGPWNQQSNGIYNTVTSVMRHGADCRKNPFNVIPFEEATSPKGAPKTAVPGVFHRAGLKLDL